jgi:hypothetical protein
MHPVSSRSFPLEEGELATLFQEPNLLRSDSPPPVDLPQTARITKLLDTLEIKRRWLRSESNPQCQCSRHIRPHFADGELDSDNESQGVEKIKRVFDQVRGKYTLWQEPRERAKWTRIEVELPLDWARRHVQVLFPSSEQFSVSRLDGIVLWDEGELPERKRYQLYEGNHRFSTWLATGTPPSLPTVMFIGRTNGSNLVV